MEYAGAEGGGRPRVSVIMTVRNCGFYLRACVDSLAAQFFASFEIVIVDDGSTDGTSQILDELISANPNLLIKSARNLHTLGIAASRNRALSLAEGEYSAVMDGDDLCRADRLAQQVNFLDANPGCFCVGSVAMSISADGTPQEIMDYGVRSHEQVVEQLLAGLNPIINSSTMFRRREAIQTLSGYTTEGPAAIVEDLDFWYRTVLAGLRFHVLPDPLVFYRSNPAGHTYTRNQEIRQAHQLRLDEFRRKFDGLRRGADFGLGRKSKIENLKCDGPHPGPHPNPLPEGEGTLRAPGRFSRRSPGGPIRAAFLTPVLHLGGAEQWLLSLLKRCDPSRLRWTGVALADRAPVHAGFCREVAAHAPIYGSDSAPQREHRPLPDASRRAAGGGARRGRARCLGHVEYPAGRRSPWNSGRLRLARLGRLVCELRPSRRERTDPSRGRVGSREVVV